MQQEFGFEDPTFGVETAIRMVDSQMAFLGMMWLEGEVSEFKAYRGVNWYYTLKDFHNVKATLRCAMFQKHTKGSKRPSVGDRVLIKGEFKLKNGNVQFVVYKLQKMESRGAHEIRLEQLKKQLKSEGLFDEERKRELPDFPRRIGIVTSKESAALQDVLKVLGDRLPNALPLLSDTTTEGTQAAPDILRAIELLQLEGECDVIIVTRGGGSRESLMGFNDESVVRAIANCDVPVVCAIGHETDYTLAELVADLRASTPTKAALEVAAISEEDIAHRLRFIRQRLHEMVRRRVQHQRELLEHIQLKPPQQLLMVQQERLQRIQQRIRERVQYRIESQRRQLQSLHEQLEALSPQHILQKGFSVVLKEGAVITQATQVQSGDRLVIQLAEGTIEVEVVTDVKTKSKQSESGQKSESRTEDATPLTSQKTSTETQLSLFE